MKKRANSTIISNPYIDRKNPPAANDSLFIAAENVNPIIEYVKDYSIPWIIIP